jgi:N-carbamoyl-D-amino-acid hydrolase
MSRTITVAAAQSGPVHRNTTRAEVVERMLIQMRQAHLAGCQLVVYTESALTAFFSHWWIDDEDELDTWFETEMPGPATQPLFDEAARLGIGFSFGYAELAKINGHTKRFNTSILVGLDGNVVGKHRKIHLPGHIEHRPLNPFQNLEKRYFEVGDLGFQTWDAFDSTIGMMICNDRRWSESYRLLGLSGAEMILIGYNTPDNIPEYPELDRLVGFQHELCMQAGALQNAAWVIAVGKAGVEAGVSMIGLTSIIAPSGEIVAQSTTLGDELVIHECDLDQAMRYRQFLDFEQNRRPELYGRIVQ